MVASKFALDFKAEAARCLQKARLESDHPQT